MIYVITHKAFDDSIVPQEGYRILHVGENENCKSSYLRDDLGNNISFKNTSWCELTGLYWIWKNGLEALDENVGLVHYRRYFTTSIENESYKVLGRLPQPLSYQAIRNMNIDSHSILLPKSEKMIYFIEEAYAINHRIQDSRTTRDAIRSIFPQYAQSFDSVMRQKFFYGYNMMVCQRRMLNAYCEWLFPILEYVEQHTNLNEIEDSYQKRIFGFISERLIQVWVYHQQFQVLNAPVFNVEKKGDNWIRSAVKRGKAYQIKRKRVTQYHLNDQNNKNYHV